MDGVVVLLCVFFSASQVTGCSEEQVAGCGPCDCAFLSACKGLPLVLSSGGMCVSWNTSFAHQIAGADCSASQSVPSHTLFDADEQLMCTINSLRLQHTSVERRLFSYAACT